MRDGGRCGPRPSAVVGARGALSWMGGSERGRDREARAGASRCVRDLRLALGSAAAAGFAWTSVDSGGGPRARLRSQSATSPVCYTGPT
jgi:hypothetical protein